MNKQEIFDKVAKHLIDQNELARDPIEGKCKYRASNGLKCAIGCLIPDDKYIRLMDFMSAPLETNGWVQSALGDIGIDVSDRQTMNFLNSLQSVHDFHPTTKWRTELRRVAATFDLEVPEFLKAKNDTVH